MYVGSAQNNDAKLANERNVFSLRQKKSRDQHPGAEYRMCWV